MVLNNQLWNKQPHFGYRTGRIHHALSTVGPLSILTLTLTLLSGCTVVADRESPLNKITRDSPTALSVYRGSDTRSDYSREQKKSAQDQMRERTSARPIRAGDELTQRYWSAVEPMQQRFARLPNPDLVMVVYPHLARGRYPVPGYVTVFPMYEETEYALPGEVQEDLLAWRSTYMESSVKPSPSRSEARGTQQGGVHAR